LFFNSIFIYFTTITNHVHITYTNPARWYGWLRSCSLRVGFCYEKFLFTLT